MIDVHHFDEVVSTNDTLLAMAQGGAPSGTAVLASRQTGGRGRRGRTWLTLPGEHVLMSVLWRPPTELDGAALTGVTLAVGVAVVDELALLGVAAQLKWPNDIWIGERKVAGMLTELHDDATGRCVVIGLGVDVNADTVPAELATIATTLSLELGHGVDAAALALRLVRAVRSACDAYAARGGLDVAAFRARCMTIGRQVRVDGRLADAIDVAADGALLVVWDGRPEGAAMGGERVVAGDVELVGRHG